MTSIYVRAATAPASEAPVLILEALKSAYSVCRKIARSAERPDALGPRGDLYATAGNLAALLRGLKRNAADRQQARACDVAVKALEAAQIAVVAKSQHAARMTVADGERAATARSAAAEGQGVNQYARWLAKSFPARTKAATKR